MWSFGRYRRWTRLECQSRGNAGEKRTETLRAAVAGQEKDTGEIKRGFCGVIGDSSQSFAAVDEKFVSERIEVPRDALWCVESDV